MVGEEKDDNSEVESSKRSHRRDVLDDYYSTDSIHDLALDPFNTLMTYTQRCDDFKPLDDKDLDYFDGGEKNPQEETIKELCDLPSINGAKTKTDPSSSRNGDLDPVPSSNLILEQHRTMVPVGAVTHVVVSFKEKYKPMNVGSVLLIRETKAPLGHVVRIIGSVTKPSYVVRLDSNSRLFQHTQISLKKCNDSSSDKDKEAQSETTKRRMMSGEEENCYSRKKRQNTNMVLENRTGSQMAQLPSQNQMLNHLQQNLRSNSQITEPNRGGHGSTLFNQPCPNVADPMMLNLLGMS